MKATQLFLPAILVICTSLVSAQNVGIGTTTPTLSRLQVVSPLNVAQISLSGGTDMPGLSVSTPLGLQTSLSFNLLWGNAFRLLAPGYGANFNYNHASGLLSFGTTQTKGIPGETMFFNNAQFYIDSSGNVGIGTSVPKNRFHATTAIVGPTATEAATGYILSVGGKIICEEVKVQLRASWPDYVFEKDYPMLSLDALEEKVMSDKHLPGIFSAAEVNNAQGIEMGDMQKRMLEKMEELYRYVFEVNRENKKLKERVAALENQPKQ